MIALELGDRQAEASAIHQLGIIFQNMGDYERARESFDQALMIARELGDRRAEASAIHQLGIIFQDIGDYGRARESSNNP